MKFSIHGIPIYGRIPKKYISTLYKISSMTTREQWKGIKGIFLSDRLLRKEELKGLRTGCYCSTDSKNPKGTIFMPFEDGTTLKVSLTNYKKFPLIIACGLEEEYWFIFNLLHELGHHVNRFKEKTQQLLSEREVNAHLFALSILDKCSIKAKEYYDFYYLDLAKIINEGNK